MMNIRGTLSSPLVRRLLWRTVGFAFAAFAMLSAAELWFERANDRAEVHSQAQRAAGLSLASIEHAVWTYDEPNLRVAVQSLLSDSSVASVSVETSEPSMRLRMARPDARPRDDAPVWSLPLLAPNRTEVLGRVEIKESFRQVDADLAARAAYRVPIELLKVLGIVGGLTLLAYVHVVARLRSLAGQIRALEKDTDDGALRDIGARRYGDDEIGELAAALNAMLAQRAAGRAAALARERAEAASAAKSEVLSRISHELRTPLNAIVGFAHVLRSDEVISADPIRADRIELIGKAGRHLSALIGDLMDFSRTDRGSERVQLRAVALNAVCRDALALVAADASAAGIELAHRYEADAAWVHADPMRLGQVLLNLLSNAIKYNRERGRVELTASLGTDGRVEIRVADDGLGMDTSQLANMFQPFNRLGREGSAVPGNGLGLVISRRLLEMMEGELTVESVERQGSIFTIRLPASTGGPVDSEDAVTAAVGHKPPPGARACVLYVEDDPVNVEVMRAVLRAPESVDLHVATTLAEAIEALGGMTPQLMLLDMHLPDGDGASLLRRLRADPAFAELPVLMVSADAEVAGEARAIAAGANAYFSKPIDFAGLTAAINEILSGQSLATR